MIECHRLRQDFLHRTENWCVFEQKIFDQFAKFVSSPDTSDTSAIDACLQVEKQIRDLCTTYFPRIWDSGSPCPQVRSMTAQMWYARRQLMRPRMYSLQDVFTCWRHVVTFARLHYHIRKQNKLNRKARLDTFLRDNIPLVLQNHMHEWYKRVRTLCPKQIFRRIQMFDEHGAPLLQAQELDRLIQYFQVLVTDAHEPLPHPPGVSQLPFGEENVLHEFCHISVTKAIVFRCIEQAWRIHQSTPPPHWSAGWIHLFAKPNKPEALRPICLQHPVNKIIPGVHCHLIIKQAYPFLRILPLFAYMPHRGPKDYLLIVSSHCRTMRYLCKHTTKTSWSRVCGEASRFPFTWRRRLTPSAGPLFPERSRPSIPSAFLACPLRLLHSP